jgi:eukaryotic-like serine/threonine-protein kinase
MSISDSEQYNQLDQLAEEFAARYGRGERPALKEYTDRYPELAEEIRELFPALIRAEQAEGVPQGKQDEEVTGASPAPNPPPRQIGDYLILREIGRGGMGVVYEAEQISLGRRVALKVLPGQVSSDRLTRERFRREARAAARLHHTNIVPVFDVGQDGEVRYYAMQFIQGQGLDAIITELQRLVDRARSQSKVEVAARDRSLWPHPDRSGQGTLAPTVGEGVEVSAVLQYILTGRFDHGGRSPELVGASPSMLARALAGGMATPTGTRTESQAAGTDRAFAPTEAGTATAGSASGPTLAHPPAPALTPLAPTSSTSAILPGGTQLSSIESRRRGFFRGLAQIGRQVAAGLAYAHARGIVHRDIKPSNLLLDTEGVVWIADFGLAKGEDEGLTQSGDILGTLRYMAPERFRGEGDARADVYALGMTLYELLTLRPGFDSPDRLKLIEHIKTEEPQRPRAIDARIPRDLETIVLKAIEKEPKARYASAEAMGEDLGRFLADEPIRARPVSASERYWRWARRNPLIAALGAVLTAVLVLATVSSLIVAGRLARLAEKARDSAQAERSLREVADRAVEAAGERERAERWERYRSNIAEASAAQQLQNSSTGERPLHAAPEEHCNWEWRHLSSQLDGASLVLSVPQISYFTVRLSPDARQIAVGNGRGEVRLFDAGTGRPGPVLRGHAGAVYSIEYTPDGRRLASGSADGTIVIWDPATGRQQLVLRGGGDLRLLYSPDGQRIVSNEILTGAVKCKYRLWDATTGRQLALLGESRRAAQVAPDLPMAFRPDGKRVVVAAEEFLRVCDAETGRPLSDTGPPGGHVVQVAFGPDGKRFVVSLVGGPTMTSLRDGESGEVITFLSEQKDGAFLVAFSADGSRMATAGVYPDNVVRLWETGSGKLIRAMAGHTNQSADLRFSPDGKRLASGSNDQTGRLWDGQTGQPIAVLRGHTGLVVHVTFSPDGTRLLTASDDHTLRLWDAGSGDLITVLRGHRNRVRSPIYTPDGSRLISASFDDTVRIWDMKLVERNGVLRGHTSFVYDVAFRPDGQEVASAAWDGTVRLWDPDTGRPTGLLRHESEVTTSAAHRFDSDITEAVAYSPDGRRIVTVNRALGVTLWKAATGERERSWPVDGKDVRAAFSPDGTLVAAGSHGGPVRLWDAATGERIAELAGHKGRSGDVAFALDGATLATTGDDGTVRLWDVATKQSVAVLRGHTAVVNRVAYSPDGGLIASGSEDATVRLWDRRTHEARAAMNVGSRVYGVAFSPDGTRLAVGCSDTTIRLIDVAHRHEVAALRGHTDYVHAVAWSPDGTRLVSGSGDFTVRVWDSLSIQDRARASQAKPTRGDDPFRPR